MRIFSKKHIKTIPLVLILFTFQITAFAQWPLRNAVELQQRDGLPNFFYKAKNGDTTKVAFFGGSITQQHGWRPKVVSWMKDYYQNENIVDYNIAIGGTDSKYGVFRSDRQLLYRDDFDLIFIEFAVNDEGMKETSDVEKSIEGLIQKIWKINPYTDICMVYTVRGTLLPVVDSGKMNLTASKHDSLASYYNIPSVFWGLECNNMLHSDTVIFNDEIANNETSQNKTGQYVFAKDVVHPTNFGHQVYADVLARCFKKMDSNDQIFAHKLKTPLLSDNYSDAKMLAVNEKNNHGFTVISEKGKVGYIDYFRKADQKYLISEDQNAYYSFAFTGSELGINTIIGPSVGNFIIEVDGNANEFNPFDKYCTYHRLASQFIKVPYGEHQVKIYPSPNKLSLSEKEGILDTKARKNDIQKNPEKYIKNELIFLDVFILGELKNTNDNILPTTKESEIFKLIPLPQQFDIYGISKLKHNDIKRYFSVQNTDIPVRGDLLKNIRPAKNESKAQIIYSLDESLDIDSEAYKLEISEKQIIITAKDKAGLFYGFMTLEQLMEDAKEQDVNLPLCNIVDFPLLAYRAIHLDIKHHREKKNYYYKLMDKLGKYKVNAIILEVEDKLAYKRQPEVGSADALSINEWKDLCNYAYERNIEISPLIQGLGHSSFILKHEKYKDLRDKPESDWAFNPLNPKTYEVQFDLYLDAIEATPHGKYLHIGGDEVHTTGRESGMSSLELQLIWLNKVTKFAEEHGRIPIFWDDMPLKYANVYRPMYKPNLSQQEVDKIWDENEHKLLEFLDQFPKNCIYMRWNYHSAQSIGNMKAMEWFRNNGMQVMGAAAGQTRWKLMPQREGNIENIKSFAAASVNNGLNGLLLTLWDDDSPHFELYMRGIIAFAEYSWTGEKRSKEDLKYAYRQREFSYTLANKKYAFIDQLEKPVAYWKNALIKKKQRNNLRKHKNAIDKLIIDLPDLNNKGEWNKKYEKRLIESAKVLNSCDSIAAKITIMKSQASHNIYTLEIYEQVNKLVRFTAQALLDLKVLDATQNKEQEIEAMQIIKQLPEKFTELRTQFEFVYGKTRLLEKPNNYILDQDHHNHLANQSINFDWQFYAEILFLEKIDSTFKINK